jgi:hypothetical protein
MFVKSGGSGSSIGMQQGQRKAINAHGFLEDDQTNLYMQVRGWVLGVDIGNTCVLMHAHGVCVVLVVVGGG